VGELSQMAKAAQNAMIHVLNLKAEDEVLVVTDEVTQRIGEAFQNAAAEYGCRVATYTLVEQGRPMTEVPGELRDMLEGKTVAINAFKALAEEVPFRIKWILDIIATKRILLGHCPGITEKMMTEGPMNVDYPTMLANAENLMQSFQHAKSTHITTAGGSDLVLDIEDRAFLTDVKATIEHGSNLPCGEIFCAPVETAANGLLVIDGTVSHLGQLTQPLHMTLRDGRIQKMECEDQEMITRVEKLLGADDEAKVIGELGIGVNPGAKLVGNMLEDEKAFRTAHIAFGNNAEFPGGQNHSTTHHDFLFRQPTFVVTYKDGSTRTLIEDGEFRV